MYLNEGNWKLGIIFGWIVTGGLMEEKLKNHWEETTMRGLAGYVIGYIIHVNK